MVTHEHVRDIMTGQAVVIGPDADLAQAHALMTSHGIRHLPVVDGRRVVGILSDRDILGKATSAGGALRIEAARVRDVMSVGVVTCAAGERLGDVADRMLRDRIDALPVVDEKSELIGILTSADLVAALRRFAGLTDAGAAWEGRIARVESERPPDPG